MPEVCPRFSRYGIWREMESASKLKFVHTCMIGRLEPNNLGSVYMRKLVPARVSYRDYFLISFHVYMMSGSFHISLCEGTLHVNKIHVWFKIGHITHALPVPDRFHTETCGRFAFTWYRCEISYRSEILAPVQQPGWTHADMAFCGGIM